MRVRVIKAIANGTQVINPGCELDLPAEEAKALINGGKVEPVEPAARKQKRSKGSAQADPQAGE